MNKCYPFPRQSVLHQNSCFSSPLSIILFCSSQYSRLDQFTERTITMMTQIIGNANGHFYSVISQKCSSTPDSRISMKSSVLPTPACGDLHDILEWSRSPATEVKMSTHDVARFISIRLQSLRLSWRYSTPRKNQLGRCSRFG